MGKGEDIGVRACGQGRGHVGEDMREDKVQHTDVRGRSHACGRGNVGKGKGEGICVRGRGGYAGEG